MPGEFQGSHGLGMGLVVALVRRDGGENLLGDGLVGLHGERTPLRRSITYQLRGWHLSRLVSGPRKDGTRLFYLVTNRCGSVVAVGTTLADRPPPRSVRARLRIRLLRRMGGVEACIGIGVQNSGWRNPPVQDWGKAFPIHLRALTAADQNALP